MVVNDEQGTATKIPGVVSGIPFRVRGGRKKFSGLIVAVNRLSRADCDIIVDVRMKESVLGYIHLSHSADFSLSSEADFGKEGKSEDV